MKKNNLFIVIFSVVFAFYFVNYGFSLKKVLAEENLQRTLQSLFSEKSKEEETQEPKPASKTIKTASPNTSMQKSPVPKTESNIQTGAQPLPPPHVVKPQIANTFINTTTEKPNDPIDLNKKEPVVNILPVILEKQKIAGDETNINTANNDSSSILNAKRPHSAAQPPLLETNEEKTVNIKDKPAEKELFVEQAKPDAERRTVQENLPQNIIDGAIGPLSPEMLEKQKPVYIYSKEIAGENNAQTAVDNSRSGTPSYLSDSDFERLYKRVYNVSGGGRFFKSRINIRGELRYHNMLNSSGNPSWDRDRSGLRMRLHFNTHVYDDWYLYTMAEIKRDIKNYSNDIMFFERYYLEGHLGQFLTTVGRFGYLMADGNIYDSGFKGVRFYSDDKHSLLNYTLALGETYYTKNTAILTANYQQSNYSLEAGAYHYKSDFGTNYDVKNTILNFAGTYNLGDVSLGVMYLGASKADLSGAKNGYVVSLKYLEPKSWIRNSYSFFLKYYDQPRHTYIAHGMDGLGSWMHGFSGWGVGFSYVPGKNMLAGIEYFDLKDKLTGVKGKTTWLYLSYYF